MAALSGITAVRPTSNTGSELVPYGATISAGQTLYRDATDGLYKLADCNDTTATAEIRGVAITPGVSGGYGYIAKSGSIILVGTTMAVGTTYYVGQTAGSIDPTLTTSDKTSRVGDAATTTQMDLAIKATGIVHA